MSKFIVRGKKRLKGEIRVSGSKNAALPIICAALLTKEKSIIHNVPEIADVFSIIEIVKALGVDVDFKDNVLTLNPANISEQKMPLNLFKKMRASILLIPPLLKHFKKADIPFPGGCVLGKRSVSSHSYVFQELGGQLLDETKSLKFKIDKIKGKNIILPEMSVTATENAIMLAAIAEGNTEIRLAAAEPHVQDLCHFLNEMGAKISGIGTNTLSIEGVNELSAASGYQVTGDYLEAGTYAIAALVTGGDVKITGIDPHQLDSFIQKLNEIGAKLDLGKDYIHVLPESKLENPTSFKTAVYPGFATDLQAPFVVLLTQIEGVSKVFETLFEGRLNYLFELEKMGAHIELLNPHQAIIIGKANLKGVPISSWDIRAGAAMIIAALCAEGETEISNINYIDRGYEKLSEKLTALGADIKRV